ncbi:MULTISPECIES: c-type cytochrome [Pseudomonas fluorescens group]|jgi:nitric oxide reductase subunit C|uniref:C-type cytochrome n=2 Tax=Pseudomonas fluorescens group TaxID=136843 RepID=A0ABS9F1R2_9PSED|nr:MULTISPECIES: cytochrome c [Pseudomonas fluorescens group]MBI6556079.1 c-type cytochrome [Pseudomonas veronii]MBI6653343.1 c-type cytochrome [Pseudomonas veronii]MCF4982150.1 c-type cytochrome [Pseudomonas gessardii]MCF4992961.1 c-type cytochrome [Pseudomonas gessardii]MCF5087920.1 c-type cytochrome [Pseudomonas gessardii]
MNKRQTRSFALISTAIAAVVFLGMTVDSHRQFPKLTNAQQITPEVTRGKDVWHEYNCINCHTLFGEGAYYAPDLTKITQQRGTPYLTAFLKDPSKFYDEQRHRRLMPNLKLNDEEIAALIAFMDWVSKVDNQGWPPRPILVTGTSIPGMDLTVAQQNVASGNQPPAARPVSGKEDPIALGEALFRTTATPVCSACHSIAPGVNLAGPTLAGLAARAKQVIASPDYKGKAKEVEGFIRESIVTPSAYLHPGDMYSANGMSFMPDTFAKSLTPEQIDQLVAYLASFQ